MYDTGVRIIILFILDSERAKKSISKNIY